MNDIKERLIKYTKNKKVLVIILLLTIGLFLLLIPSDIEEVKNPEVSDYSVRESEEKRLVRLLNEIDGVKSAKVMLSFSDNGSKEYYFDESEALEEDRVKKDSKLVALRGDKGELPVVIREKTPEISGVSVIINCSKKQSEEVIYKTVSKALGIEIHKIQIVINDRR